MSIVLKLNVGTKDNNVRQCQNDRPPLEDFDPGLSFLCNMIHLEHILDTECFVLRPPSDCTTYPNVDLQTMTLSKTDQEGMQRTVYDILPENI